MKNPPKGLDPLKSLHVCKPMASSDFLFSWTLEKGILKPANAGKPFTSLADLHKWAIRNKFNSIAQHGHIVYTEIEETKEGTK